MLPSETSVIYETTTCNNRNVDVLQRISLGVCSSWRLRGFERLLRLTESFTWEDLPTRDPHTGHRTLVGWIPHLQEVMKYVYAFTALYHLVQSGVRMYVSHELMYSAWYPFDTVSSPGYEIAILMQVILYFHCS
jgi:hypothetical protein